MNCVGAAGDKLSSLFVLDDDLLDESVDTQSKALEASVIYTNASRKIAETSLNVGNYIVRVDEGKQELFVIVESDQRINEHVIEIYAEGGGIDLINDIVPKLEGKQTTTIDEYVSDSLENTDFEIGVNELEGEMLELSLNEQTVSERLKDISKSFGCEMETEFVFSESGFNIEGKYVNIRRSIGRDTGEIISLYKNLSEITVKKSIANLCTSIIPKGNNDISISGLDYDDGDYYVDGNALRSRNAAALYGRYTQNKFNSYAKHLTKQVSINANTKTELLRMAIEELKRVSEPEVNYETEFYELPEGVSIGDRVNLVDDEGEIYVSSRLLEIKRSVTKKTVEVTIGDNIIRTSGIADKVSNLANKFGEIANKKTEFTELYLVKLDKETLVVVGDDIPEQINRRVVNIKENAEAGYYATDKSTVIEYKDIDVENVPDVSARAYAPMMLAAVEEEDNPEDMDREEELPPYYIDDWDWEYKEKEASGSGETYDKNIVRVYSPTGQEAYLVFNPEDVNTGNTSAEYKIIKRTFVEESKPAMGREESDKEPVFVQGTDAPIVTESEDINYKYYYTKGDEISVDSATGGYITNSGKDVGFTIPLPKPILNAQKVTINDSNGGVLVRQGGKYCYGSTSTTYSKPKSYSVRIVNDGGALFVYAQMRNTTNAINNDACGVHYRFKIKVI